MTIPTEEDVLGILNEYKWEDNYSCYKCGCTEYKKGKQLYSRRCKACDYDESLLKFTAFEGTKMPIGKAYAIVEHLVTHCAIDWDSEDILLERRRRNAEDDSYLDNVNEGEAISINEILDRYKGGEISRAKADKLLQRNMDSHSINLSEIARIFDVEENSVSKLLDRVSDRFTIIENRDEQTTSTEHVCSILREGGKELDYFIGLLMVPMRGSWVDNKLAINDKTYFTVAPPYRLRKNLDDTRWRIIEVEIYQPDSNN